jgi:predicted AAA+ superfamily ATPase
MYLERHQTKRLNELFAAFPAVVVSGARQVGKSTLVNHIFAGKADIVVFDPVIDIENARRDPELFLNNHRTPLVLDEFQYAPELAAAIKRRIDRNRAPGQYILTGSQQWGVLKSISESLAGRAVFLDLESFSLAEICGFPGTRWLESWLSDPEGLLAAGSERLEPKTPLWEQLWRGWLPEAQVVRQSHIPDFHAGYLRTYIERDARLIGDVSDWQSFGRFARLAAALTAQELRRYPRMVRICLVKVIPQCL